MVDVSTVAGRLEIYKKALIDYTESLNLNYEEKCEKDTGCGFCWYFYMKHDINTYYEFEKIFPELYLQKPENKWSCWFYDGEIAPRVKCLEDAIKLCEDQI